MDHATEHIEVEVAYALPQCQFLKRFHVPSGTTIEQAITLSGIREIFTEIDLEKQKMGIFSKLTQPGTILQNGDRVEIYRPLLLDPKEKRRIRLKEKLKK
ncbi:RnfH family protein [Nitrosomonas sp. Is37]|uniref:RnfH family protein n=1 Tax=Nitrosomonas sp. Is37 TaxID=3080535 RepID=UPI00294B5930|nr:RnfH family protein [Nitrosomonas sp. Is37]MDV6344343.1 RnfH family protein [Nitrosomonas sp. Is37]